MHIQSLTCQSRGLSFPAPLRDGAAGESAAFPPNRKGGCLRPGAPRRGTGPRRSPLKARDASGSHRALPSTRDSEPLPAREKLK